MSSLLEAPATSVYHSEPGLALYLGDAETVLAELPADSVHCSITSPPYFGLRDYGVEGQIGMEDTLDEYVERLVLTFRALRGVLRPEGVFWLNIADRFVGKQVVPVSWTLAFALHEDGWLLRAPVVWQKPNAIPSSAKDRPGLDYEHVLMLTKTKFNYFNIDIKAEYLDQTLTRVGEGR